MEYPFAVEGHHKGLNEGCETAVDERDCYVQDSRGYPLVAG
jgi:hypothetical protein